MADNHSLVHINQLEAFTAFLVDRGWKVESPVGSFVVLRVRHEKVKKPLGLQATLAHAFIRLKRRKRARRLQDNFGKNAGRCADRVEG